MLPDCKPSEETSPFEASTGGLHTLPLRASWPLVTLCSLLNAAPRAGSSWAPQEFETSPKKIKIDVSVSWLSVYWVFILLIAPTLPAICIQPMSQMAYTFSKVSCNSCAILSNCPFTPRDQLNQYTRPYKDSLITFPWDYLSAYNIVSVSSEKKSTLIADAMRRLNKT